MSVRLVLHPRGDGRHYDVEYEGALLVSASDDPEHDVARVLVAKCIVGTAVMIDGHTGTPRLRFDISVFARTRTVERSAGGITIEPWRPLPSPSSHGEVRTRFSKSKAGVVANDRELASVTLHGTSGSEPRR